MSNAAARVFASSVFAVPGTPSRSTWPSTSNAVITPLSTPCWPTITFPTSSRTSITARRAADSPTDDVDIGAPSMLGDGGCMPAGGPASPGWVG